MMDLFGEPITAQQILRNHHYLGASKRGHCYQDDAGVLVFANPSSRMLPHSTWVELTRWCITSDEKNAGSRQWRRASAWLRSMRPELTTVVSYSDPSVGHIGALYRACNWLWAPTWHRLRTPPTANGRWTTDGAIQAAKDRWVFCLRDDSERESVLAIHDDSVLRRFPYAEYKERRGGDFKRWLAERAS